VTLAGQRTEWQLELTEGHAVGVSKHVGTLYPVHLTAAVNK